MTQLADAIVFPDLGLLSCRTVDISNIIQERLKGVEETLQQFSEAWSINYAKAIVNLDLYAEQGWFVETMYVDLSDFFKIINKEHDCIDSVMSDYYRTQLDRLEQDLLARHPKRQSTIIQVFAAHRKEWYHLTSTTIFSLVDGICVDEASLNIKFFDKNRNNDYSLKLADKMKERDTDEMFMRPLMSNKPVFSHQNDLESFPCKLNRHAIMHGQDPDYGTEINSLKSISLLAYISDLVTYSREVTNRRNDKQIS
jgi:hypothetical protein